MQSVPAPPVGAAATGVECVIDTEVLTRRPTRAADFAAENTVLQALAGTMAQSPQRVLQELVDGARELCGAGSAGISLLDTDGSAPATQFRWAATSGEFSRYRGNSLPRDFSPCGAVLDRNCLLLMSDPARYFPYIEGLSHPVREVLLVPFHRGAEPIGTVWVAQHTLDRVFDREDARIVTSLSKFAAAAVHVLSAVEANRKLETAARVAAEHALARLAIEHQRITELSQERERAVAASQHSEARYRAIIDASPECVTIVDSDGVLLQANAAALLMLEVDDESAASGRSVFDRIAPESLLTYRAFHERVCGGEPGTLCFDVIGARGTRRTVETSSVPLASGKGRFDKQSISRDVTQRRRAETALELELKDASRLRDVASRLIGGDDPSALYEEILLAAMEITAADAGTIQLLDQSSHTLGFLATRGFPPAMTEHFARVDAGSDSPCGIALARGERVVVEFPSDGPVGGSDQLHFDLGLRCAQSTPLISRSGRPLGMFSTHWRSHRALTEREVRFLDLLARQAADLIERSQAQDALREADRRKDEFLAVLAHELRNPLVPIRTGIDLLSRVAEQPALIEKIRPMMERQVAHVVRLIDDLLDVSRITAGKIELQLQRVTLSSVITSAVEANRSAIANAGLQLTMHIEEPDRLIEVDPTRFSQVIGNILHNATKFTPSGGMITLEAFVQSTPGEPELVLRITDTGVGIAPESLPAIFGLFTQLHDGNSGRQAGLGIGLALAQKLLELHGGRIHAYSAGLGQGSQFIACLPAPEVLADGPLLSAQRAPLASRPRVLVVDDNRDAADSIGLLVANMGADVRVVYDGASALQVLDTYAPTLMLLDIGMPEIDGYQLCRRIRALKGPHVVLVAITGWGQEDDRRRAAEAGFDSHMTKPVDAAELESLVRAAVERFAETRELAGASPRLSS